MNVVFSQQLPGAIFKNDDIVTKYSPCLQVSKTDKLLSTKWRTKLDYYLDILSDLTVNSRISALASIPSTCNCSESGRGHYRHTHFSVKNKIKSRLLDGF